MTFKGGAGAGLSVAKIDNTFSSWLRRALTSKDKGPLLLYAGHSDSDARVGAVGNLLVIVRTSYRVWGIFFSNHTFLHSEILTCYPRTAVGKRSFFSYPFPSPQENLGSGSA